MSMSRDGKGRFSVVLHCGNVRVFDSVEWERVSWGQCPDEVLSDIEDEMCCECRKWIRCSFHARRVNAR